MIDLSQCKKVLSFFAHPDDETLAAGATIHKMSEMGIEVHVAIPATGIHSRRNVQEQDDRDTDLEKLRQDCGKSMNMLGVRTEHIYLGEFADNEMDKHTLLEIIHWLEQLLEKIKPDLVFTHHRFCTNIDHRYCHEAAVVATRPGVNQHITVVTGEVPSSTGYLKPARWEPNMFIEISEANLQSKIDAMENYEGEARKDPHPRSKEVLRALAKVRGSESGYHFAESFMISKTFA